MSPTSKKYTASHYEVYSANDMQEQTLLEPGNHRNPYINSVSEGMELLRLKAGCKIIEYHDIEEGKDE